MTGKEWTPVDQLHNLWDREGSGAGLRTGVTVEKTDFGLLCIQHGAEIGRVFFKNNQILTIPEIEVRNPERLFPTELRLWIGRAMVQHSPAGKSPVTG